MIIIPNQLRSHLTNIKVELIRITLTLKMIEIQSFDDVYFATVTFLAF